jgi:hypothetical protein
MATNKAVEMQAAMYVYDLNNTAREFGFKPDEGWELNTATKDEMVLIGKRYHPTISTKVLPEILSEMFGLVKDKLIQVKSEIRNNLQTGGINNTELQYLVAFNPKRPRH